MRTITLLLFTCFFIACNQTPETKYQFPVPLDDELYAMEQLQKIRGRLVNGEE